MGSDVGQEGNEWDRRVISRLSLSVARMFASREHGMNHGAGPCHHQDLPLHALVQIS